MMHGPINIRSVFDFIHVCMLTVHLCTRKRVSTYKHVYVTGLKIQVLSKTKHEIELFLTERQVSYVEVLGDKSTMHIEVTLF